MKTLTPKQRAKIYCAAAEYFSKTKHVVITSLPCSYVY